MKLLKFFTLRSKRKPLVLRQIVGHSMDPNFIEGRVVVASGWFNQLKSHDVVIIFHDGMEKIKRIEHINGDELYVRGDNPSSSTDSRQFGWIDMVHVQAKVLWPRVNTQG